MKDEKLKLPRNIRQIGDIEDVAKIYIEDYANTYLKKLRPAGGQGLKVGLLVGHSEIQDGIPYIFVEGALEIEGLNATPDNINFTNEIWTNTYDDVKKFFDGLSIQGWFICGSLDVKLDAMSVWNLHTQYFPGKHQLLYISPTYELDESMYVTSINGFYKTVGHCIYYERNEAMQDYMILRKEARRIEPEVNDQAIQTYRAVMEEKKEVVRRNRTVQMLYSACTFLTLVICAIGVTLINTHDKMKSMEAALVQLSQGGSEAIMVNEPLTTEADQTSSAAGESGSVIVNEIPGNVFPTTEAATTQQPTSEEPTTAEPAVTEPESQPPEEEQTEPSKEESQPATEAETQAAVAEGETSYDIHIVESGETLYSICVDYYGSLNMVDQLSELNGLDDQDFIYIGQELKMP